MPRDRTFHHPIAPTDLAGGLQKLNREIFQVGPTYLLSYPRANAVRFCQVWGFNQAAIACGRLLAILKAEYWRCSLPLIAVWHLHPGHAGVHLARIHSTKSLHSSGKNHCGRESWVKVIKSYAIFDPLNGEAANTAGLKRDRYWNSKSSSTLLAVTAASAAINCQLSLAITRGQPQNLAATCPRTQRCKSANRRFSKLGASVWYSTDNLRCNPNFDFIILPSIRFHTLTLPLNARASSNAPKV